MLASSLLLYLFTYYENNYPYKTSNLTFFQTSILLVSLFSSLLLYPQLWKHPPPIKCAHLSILLHFYLFIRTASDEILAAALFFTDSERMNIGHIALSSRNSHARLHRTILNSPVLLQLTQQTASAAALTHSRLPVCSSVAAQVLPVLMNTSSSASHCKSASCQSKSSVLLVLIQASVSTVLHIFPHPSSVRPARTWRVIFLLFSEVLGDLSLLPEQLLKDRRKGLRFSVSFEGQTHLKTDSENTTNTLLLSDARMKLPPFPAPSSFLGYWWKTSNLTAAFLTLSTAHTAVCWTTVPNWSSGHPDVCCRAAPSGSWELSRTPGITLPSLLN